MTIRQQFLGIPVRRGDNGPTGSQGKRQRPTDDLSLRKIGGHIEIRHAKKFVQSAVVYVFVLKDHVFFEVKAPDLLLQSPPIRFAFSLEHIRMGCAQDNVQRIGNSRDDLPRFWDRLPRRISLSVAKQRRGSPAKFPPRKREKKILKKSSSFSTMETKCSSKTNRIDRSRSS